MISGCTELRELLGAYVLGGLHPDETLAVERHLEACAGCRAERAELATAPALLDLATEAPPEVPRRVRDRIVAAAAERRSRRRWALVAAAVGVVATLLGGLAGWQLAPAPAVDVAVPLESVEPFDGSGWAVFRPDDGRIVVRLEVEGLEPLEDPAVYEAWLSTTDERVVSIGQLGEIDEVVTTELTVRGSMDDYDGFWITAEPDRRDPAHDGPTVVRAYVPDGR